MKLTGGKLHLMWVPALAVVVYAAGEVSHDPIRPPAVTDSRSVEYAVPTGLWAGDPVRLDATAVGVSWDPGSSFHPVWVRASEDGETWGPWTEIHDPTDHGPDADSPEDRSDRPVSEAVYVGSARWLQLKGLGAPDGLELVSVDTSGRSLSLGRRVGLFLEGFSWGSDSVQASPDQPPIQPRSAWGGDQCVAQNPDFHPHYIDRVDLLFVHHTIHSASSNSYGPGSVPDLLYAICNFHVAGQGWDDIAYNVIVDQYGTIWEGRAGGLDQPVRGAHTGGFNSHSTGVAFMGDHRSSPPTAAAQNAFIAFASWKLDVHHVDPQSIVQVESLGSTLFEEGQMVSLRAISGHRDVSQTSCPGGAVMGLLDSWAAQAAALGGAKIYGGWPSAEPIPGFEATGYQPTPFPFRFTEEMDWTFVVTDEAGVELLRQTGRGTEGAVTWDGTLEGVRQPYGTYVVRIDAVPTSGVPAPRPAEFRFVLGSFNPPFSDDEGSIHEDDIRGIFEAGITSGCGPEVFCPLDELTRWQMALFLSRTADAGGHPLPEPGADFSDTVDLPDLYRQTIAQLRAAGITSGTGDDRFEPDGVVSRWQMAYFLTRLVEASGHPLPDPISHGFFDIGAMPADTIVAIDRLAGLGITAGTGPGTFDPEAAVTREQMATFLARTLAIVRGAESPPSS